MALTIFFAISSRSNPNQKGLLSHSIEHIKHGLANILAGIIESIPIGGTILFFIRHNLGENMKHRYAFCHGQPGKLMPYRSIAKERGYIVLTKSTPNEPFAGMCYAEALKLNIINSHFQLQIAKMRSIEESYEELEFEDQMAVKHHRNFKQYDYYDSSASFLFPLLSLNAEPNLFVKSTPHSIEFGSYRREAPFESNQRENIPQFLKDWWPQEAYTKIN